MRNVVLLRWLFNIRPTDTNFPRFQSAQPDHVRVQSSSCCYLRKLVSFIRPRELMSLTHGTWRVLLQSENVLEFGSITITNNYLPKWRWIFTTFTDTEVNNCFSLWQNNQGRGKNLIILDITKTASKNCLLLIDCPSTGIFLKS